MNRNLKLIACASAVGLIAFTTPAQETTNKTSGTQLTPGRSTAAVRSVRLGRAERSSDLIGMEVRNYEGEKLGKVDDLAVDLETGRIVHVILTTGGAFGFFGTLVPVPPGALHHDGARNCLHLKADKAKLQAAPWYGMSGSAELSQADQVAQIYRYHGQTPYFTAVYQPALGPDPTARLGYVQRTTKLMGVAVKNVEKETLGRVKNLVVDLSAGRVVAVIVSSDPLLGSDAALMGVPPGAFQFNSEQTYLQLDASKEVIRRKPHFNPIQWPSFSDPAFVTGVYRAHQVEPYFTRE